jgi:hypothetical protein
LSCGGDKGGERWVLANIQLVPPPLNVTDPPIF